MLLFTAYLITGYIMFTHEINNIIMELIKEESYIMKYYDLLELVFFWSLFPLEILVHNFGGRKSLDALTIIIMIIPISLGLVATVIHAFFKEVTK